MAALGCRPQSLCRQQRGHRQPSGCVERVERDLEICVLEEIRSRDACVPCRRGDAASDSAVTLVLEGSDGARRNGERRELTASYVVGADGANSFIRGAMGSPMHDLGFFYDWLIVDLILTEPRVFDPPAWQLCDPARPTTIVPGGPGRRRWEFLRLPHEDIKDLNRM